MCVVSVPVVGVQICFAPRNIKVALAKLELIVRWVGEIIKLRGVSPIASSQSRIVYFVRFFILSAFFCPKFIVK